LAALTSSAMTKASGTRSVPTRPPRDRTLARPSTPACPRPQHRAATSIGVNGFFAALAAAARRRSDARLLAWWSERHCAKRWGRLVRPDGFGRWAEAGQVVESFPEWDTGTEVIAKVAGKLHGLATLATLATRVDR
jgi:hypothetical protein